MDELAPTLMAPDALARTLGRLGDVERPAATARPSAPADWIPAPPAATQALRRRRWAAPGVWTAQVRLEPAPPGRTYLLGVGPGIAVPNHTHHGLESLCVLKGEFEDRGEVYRPGDFVESDEEVVHRPAITRGGDCVCLIWTENALVPRSLVGWLMQPIVRI
jgi:putative transcriptional regulator